MPLLQAYHTPHTVVDGTATLSPSSTTTTTVPTRHRPHSWYGSRCKAVSPTTVADLEPVHAVVNAPSFRPTIFSKRASRGSQGSDTQDIDFYSHPPGAHGHADMNTTAARAKSPCELGGPISFSPPRSDPDSDMCLDLSPVHSAAVNSSVSGGVARPRGRSPVRRSLKRVRMPSDSDSSPSQSPIRIYRDQHQHHLSFSPVPDPHPEEEPAPSLLSSLKKSATVFVPDFTPSSSTQSRTSSRFASSSSSRTLDPSSSYIEAFQKGEEAWFGDVPEDFKRHFNKPVRYSPPLPLSRDFFNSVSNPSETEKKFFNFGSSRISLDFADFKRVEAILNASLSHLSQISSIMEGLSGLLGKFLDPEDPSQLKFNPDLSAQDFGILWAALTDATNLATTSSVDARLRLLALARENLISKLPSLSPQEKIELLSCPVQSDSVFDRDTVLEVSSAVRKRKVEDANQLLLERAIKSPRPSSSSSSRRPPPVFRRSSAPRRESSAPSRAKPSHSVPRRSSSGAPSTRGKKRGSALFR